MRFSKPLATLAAASALFTGSTVAASATTAQPDFRAEALASGLSATQATQLQQRVDKVLAAQPGGRQVSADKIQYDGGNVTFFPEGAKKSAKAAALDCDYGWLCMNVRGTVFKLYKCQKWYATNWTGDGDFVNNQTPGTVARFYNQDDSVRWTSTAYEAGRASWGPIWAVKPC